MPEEVMQVINNRALVLMFTSLLIDRKEAYSPIPEPAAIGEPQDDIQYAHPVIDYVIN